MADRRRLPWLLPLLVVALLLFLVYRTVTTRADAPELAVFSGATMGTTYHVKLVADLTAPERKRVAQTVAGRLELVNRLMSTWDPASELSRFNRHASTEPFPLSPHTLEVFRVAQDVSERSGGALDVTVGPLVEAWGFGASERGPPPSPAEIEALRARVGYRRLEVGAATVRKRAPGVVCDLSAVAKGYAVDEVARALDEMGYTDFLVEVGGEVFARGERLEGGPWRIAVEVPDPARRAFDEVVELSGRGLATSGDYRNYREEDGKRYSHLLDPRTGRPIAHALAAVSVIHERTDYADAWATALIVLGPEEGRAVAEREGLAAYFVVREGDGFRGFATAPFR